MREAVLVTLLVCLGAGPAFAQTGNGAPSGPHYNLNIIGVSKGKTADMTGSERHTIFVALGDKNNQVTSKIYLMPAEDFRVCDGNAFDPAFDCAGNQIAALGAVFELPCNTNLTLGGADVLVPCDEADPKLAYTVWARALGRPGGSATMTTCATLQTARSCARLRTSCSSATKVSRRSRTSLSSSPHWSRARTSTRTHLSKTSSVRDSHCSAATSRIGSGSMTTVD